MSGWPVFDMPPGFFLYKCCEAVPRTTRSADLIPDSIHGILRPFFCDIFTADRALLQGLVAWKHTFCFCHFPVLAFSASMILVVYIMRRYYLKTGRKSLHLQLFSQFADRIRIFFPIFPDRFQLVHACRSRLGVIHSFEIT